MSFQQHNTSGILVHEKGRCEVSQEFIIDPGSSFPNETSLQYMQLGLEIKEIHGYLLLIPIFR